MHLNGIGDAARWLWETLPEYFPNIELDQFVIMPNHIHAVLIILEREGTNSANLSAYRSHPKLGQIIRHFKSLVTYYMHAAGLDEFAWQGRFHEHVIRMNDADLKRIREYIVNNPAQWAEDDLYTS